MDEKMISHYHEYEFVSESTGYVYTIRVPVYLYFELPTCCGEDGDECTNQNS